MDNIDYTFWHEGIEFLCGIDEAGRGPLAGPVVAAAVIMRPGTDIPDINDSKKLTEKKREQLAEIIKSKALCFAIASASVDEINEHNILQATFMAMKRAVKELFIMPDYLLIDGRDFPIFSKEDGRQILQGRSVIRGDTLSLSIAAASILAKVHRDQLMTDYGREYPQYGFERHKGYATRMHRQRLIEWGACPIHRQAFVRRTLQQIKPNLF